MAVPRGTGYWRLCLGGRPYPENCKAEYVAGCQRLRPVHGRTFGNHPGIWGRPLCEVNHPPRHHGVLATVVPRGMVYFTHKASPNPRLVAGLPAVARPESLAPCQVGFLALFWVWPSPEAQAIGGSPPRVSNSLCLGGWSYPENCKEAYLAKCQRLWPGHGQRSGDQPGFGDALRVK